jgi:hypothetical protein
MPELPDDDRDAFDSMHHAVDECMDQQQRHLFNQLGRREAEI